MGVFKLGKMTMGSLFKKPETVQYPFQTKPQPAGLKGHIAIDVADCILCGMCDRSCSTDCITVDKNAGTWAIDRYQCVQCGYCITVCPKKCLSMDPNYAPAAVNRDVTVVTVSGQEKPAAKKEPEAVAEKAAKAKEPAAKEEPTAVKPVDAELQAKLAMMDPEKAEKVRAAHAAR